MHATQLYLSFSLHLKGFSYLNLCLLAIEFSYLLFHATFARGPESATFWLATMKFPTQIYPSQTKILESRANLSECVFEALFKGVSTRFGLQTVETCFEKAFGKVLPTFQNLRLGSIKFMLPKRTRYSNGRETHRGSLWRTLAVTSQCRIRGINTDTVEQIHWWCDVRLVIFIR